MTKCIKACKVLCPAGRVTTTRKPKAKRKEVTIPGKNIDSASSATSTIISVIPPYVTTAVDDSSKNSESYDPSGCDVDDSGGHDGSDSNGCGSVHIGEE